jgi:hypothetical protein
MTDSSPDPGLTAALEGAGLRLVGPVGTGSRGAVWSAVHHEDGRWTATVVHPRSDAHATALVDRLACLRALHHPHVAGLGEVLRLPGGGLAVLAHEVPGTDLDVVRAAKGRWSPGEVSTVLVPLGGALAAVHRAGVVHGDVAPANVVLTPDGRPVLVDLVLGADDEEAGTPGVAAAERRSRADASSDVRALAALGLLLLDGPPGRRRGAPTPPRPAPGPERHLREYLAGVVAARDRPGAAEVASRVFAICPPEPVSLPEQSALARAALRRLAAPDPVRTERLPRVAKPVRARHRRRPSRRGPVLTGVALAALAVCAATVAAASDRPDTGQVGEAEDPALAAVALSTARLSALASGDLAALRRVTVPGSRAAGADLVAAHRAAVRQSGPEPVLEVVSAGVLAPASGTPWDRTCPECVRVLLAARTGVPTADGSVPGEVRDVVLVLVRGPGGWRVRDVEEPPG